MTGLGAHRDGWRIERGEEGYPVALEDLRDPPEVIFGRGSRSALSAESLSIVGTRKPTPYGEAACKIGARAAVEAGVAVVSGGAIGCDQIAGRATLDAGGRHIIVLGTGADVVYPRRSARLIADTLESGGAVISIEHWGSPPRRYAFPKRNRIIAALSRATFVAEAGMPSGTFSTAETAAEIGREVLAVPGSIFSPQSRGTNYLIESGACIIADEEGLSCALSRVFGCLRAQPGARGELQGESSVVDAVMTALASSPLRAEEISRFIGLGSRECLELLSELVLQGAVERLIDGRYAASTSALVNRTSFGAQWSASHRVREV